jgi:predicted dehydrogenase
MESVSPVVDCGVHYVDIMSRVTNANPVRIHAIGARVSPEIGSEMYNYGHMQVVFDDGSAGWYEAGWGPMMSRTAYFIKDLIGPKGCLSIHRLKEPESACEPGENQKKKNVLLLHWSQLDGRGNFVKRDEELLLPEPPDWKSLCEKEQRFFLKAIQNQIDLKENHKSALSSLKIVLAADQSIRTKQVVYL